MKDRENYGIEREVEEKVLGRTIWPEIKKGREKIWEKYLALKDRELYYDIAAACQPSSTPLFPQEVKKRLMEGPLKIPERQVKFFTAVDSLLDPLGIDAWFEFYIFDPRTREVKILRVNLDITTNFKMKLGEVSRDPHLEGGLYYPNSKLDLGNKIMMAKRFDRRRLGYLKDPASFVPFEPEIIIFEWMDYRLSTRASYGTIKAYDTREGELASAIVGKVIEELKSLRLHELGGKLRELIIIPQEEELDAKINEIKTKREKRVQDATKEVEDIQRQKE